MDDHRAPTETHVYNLINSSLPIIGTLQASLLLHGSISLGRPRYFIVIIIIC